MGGATRDDLVEPIVATSGDIVFALSIPDSALPEGVSRDDISIRATDPGTFELLPDGLQLAEPVTVTVELPLADGDGVSAVLLSSDGSVEGLELTVSPRESVDDGTRVTFELEHFSFVLIRSSPDRGIELSIDPPAPEDEYLVGESFTINMRIDKKPWEQELPNARQSSIQDAGWMVRDQWLVELDGALEPGDADSASNTWSVNDSGQFTRPPGAPAGFYGDAVDIGGGQSAWKKTQSFTCVRPGEYGLIFRASVVQLMLESQIDPPSSGPTGFYLGVKAEFSGECTLPPIVATLSAPVTTYTIDLPAADFKFAWSGADCGTASGTDTNTYVWSHGDEDCEHAGEAHDGTPISLLIVSDKFEARCSYVSAASGTGPKCERTQ